MRMCTYWAAIVVMAAMAFAFAGCERPQIQHIERVADEQHLVFNDPGSSRSGVTLHVRGQIDGEATIDGPQWSPQTISGKVDRIVYHDYFYKTIVIDYTPSKVTSGKLSFELTFE